MPYEVENLLDIARIKILSREKSILKVAQRRENVIFYFDNSKFNFDVVDKLMKMYRNRIAKWSLCFAFCLALILSVFKVLS